MTQSRFDFLAQYTIPPQNKVGQCIQSFVTYEHVGEDSLITVYCFQTNMVQFYKCEKKHIKHHLESVALPDPLRLDRNEKETLLR